MAQTAIVPGDFTSVKVTQAGNRKLVTGKFTGTNGYVASGYVVTAAILKTIGGLQEVDFWQFEDMIKSTFADSCRCNFDHSYSSGTRIGRIIVMTELPVHTHSFLVKGGTAAAGTDVLNIKSLVIGKEEATDRTNLGTTNGGVQNSAIVEPSVVVANEFDLSGYSSRFFIVGR